MFIQEAVAYIENLINPQVCVCVFVHKHPDACKFVFVCVCKTVFPKIEESIWHI